ADRLRLHTEERRRNTHGEARAAFADTFVYPPQWVESLWVETKRQRRVVAELVQSLPLPPYGNTLEVPAYNQAPPDAANAQSADGQSVTSNPPTGATVLTANVATIAGYLDIPRQTAARHLEHVGSDLDRLLEHAQRRQLLLTPGRRNAADPD